eukprot:TRINITY_DN66002_c5_g1_i1.p1 TRINITY_DN66002_c5_g1~~TRINITY_DN66002_c5_g1_i1.p1  ORF type:complete len:325 (-),score=23.73 TRINITY_DN66002_c5_g1_i1:322-1152(-)
MMAPRLHFTEVEEKYCVDSGDGTTEQGVFISDPRYKAVAPMFAERVLPIVALFGPPQPKWKKLLGVAPPIPIDHQQRKLFGGHAGVVGNGRVWTALHNVFHGNHQLDKAWSQLQMLEVIPFNFLWVQDNKDPVTLSQGQWGRTDICSIRPIRYARRLPKGFRRSDRQPKVGDAVGIVVHRTWDLTQELVGVPLNTLPRPVEHLYGDTHQTAVLTGKITHVSPKTIEYNINAYKGCSGAVVFYLEDEYGSLTTNAEAVGVHAGAVGGSFNTGFRFPH